MPDKQTNIRKNGKAPLISATWKITIATDLYSGLLMTMWNEEHWIHKQMECSFTHTRLFTVSHGCFQSTCTMPWWASVRNEESLTKTTTSTKTNTKTMTVKGKQVHIGSSFQRCTGAVAPSPICTTSHLLSAVVDIVQRGQLIQDPQRIMCYISVFNGFRLILNFWRHRP